MNTLSMAISPSGSQHVEAELTKRDVADQAALQIDHAPLGGSVALDVALRGRQRSGHRQSRSPGRADETRPEQSRGVFIQGSGPRCAKIRRRQPDQTRAPPRAEAGPWIRFGLMTLRRQRPDARAPVNAKPDWTSPWTSLKGRGQSIPTPSYWRPFYVLAFAHPGILTLSHPNSAIPAPKCLKLPKPGAGINRSRKAHRLSATWACRRHCSPFPAHSQRDLTVMPDIGFPRLNH